MNYLVLLYQDHLYNGKMETPGSFTIGGGKKDDLKIEEMPGQIVIKENRRGMVSVESFKPMPFYDGDVPRDTMIVISKEEQTALYIADHTDTAPERLKLPYNCIARVGRSDKCHVTIKNPYVSGKHFTIRSESGQIRVEDHNSTNGLYLNGKRVSKAKLHSGDVLSIMHININLVNNELIFENVGDALTIHGLEEYGEVINGEAKTEDTGEGTLKYRRSPRTQEQLPVDPFVLAPPPANQGKYEKRRGIFGSMLGTGAMFAASMATGGVASPALLAARAASLVSPVTSIVNQTGGEKQRKTKMAEYEQMRLAKYGQYIEEQKTKISQVADLQRDILTRENPSAVECLDNLQQLKRSLWERSSMDRDFLDVRMGMGYEDLCVPVKAREENGFRMDTDELRELAEQIVEETRIVDNVPSRLPLRRYSTVGMIGERNRVCALVKNMLVSMTTAHCHEDVRVVGIFDESELPRWEFLRWLPHIWDKEGQARYLAFTPERTKELSGLFQDVLSTRAAAGGDSMMKPTAPTPHFVFLLGSRAAMERNPLMEILTSNNPALGATALFLFNDMYSLPHSCQFIVDVDNGPCGYVRNEVNKKFIFTEDPAVTDSQLDAFARTMSAIELEGFAVQAPVPQGINFLKGYGVSRVEELNAMARWKENRPYKSMAAPIGVMSGNRVFALDINEKAHGPHGLVAGTTGSGKSETIISWILSMCINYHPHEVAFVIIDYKGGGMANMIQDLPHVVGKITNIGSNINRSLTSLKSELVRRQRIFDQYQEYQINHIDKYLKLYREGKVSEPLPHLIIVADEFAELRQNEPEFMSGLVSAARIGRTLGVHLVLATQKPSGVVDDQIQSNSKFRLCLKVASVGDSREMIKRPDAASIRQPGRSYILVGEDDMFELFQSYYSGAPYMPGADMEANQNTVRMVDITGERSKQIKKEKTTVKSDMDELTAIRKYLCRVAEQNGICKLDGPWLEELPEKLLLEDLKVPGGFDGRSWPGTMPWLKAPIGIYDDPVTQSQGIQYLDLGQTGNYGIFGAPGTGKTSLLKTIVWSLGYYYSPKDINIYVLDFGGWSMNVFSDMPHVGDVALDFQVEKIQKLQKMLADELTARKNKFLKNRVSNIVEYRKITGGGMPAIVLVIDNIVPIFETYQDMEELLARIGQEGTTCGIYMIYTANATKGVRTKVTQYVKGAISFEQTDKSEYQTILGRLEGKKLSKVTGRAFAGRSPETPVEYQSALYMDGETELDRSIPMQKIATEMDAVWDGPRPARVPVMPETVSFDEVYRRFEGVGQFPVGIAYDSIQPALMDLREKYCVLISGTVGCGKSRWMQGIAKMIHEKSPADKFFVFDSQSRALSDLVRIAQGYTVMADTPEAAEVTVQIADILNERLRLRQTQMAEQGSGFSPMAFAESLPKLYILIDDITEFAQRMASSEDPRAKTPQSRMKTIMTMAKGLGVVVFAAGRVSDLARNANIELLTNILVSNQKAIGIGGKPSLHSYLNNDLNYQEKDAEMAKGDAYIFEGGHAFRIKLPE